jgi:hypothetical protein
VWRAATESSDLEWITAAGERIRNRLDRSAGSLVLPAGPLSLNLRRRSVKLPGDASGTVFAEAANGQDGSDGRAIPRRCRVMAVSRRSLSRLPEDHPSRTRPRIGHTPRSGSLGWKVVDPYLSRVRSECAYRHQVED